MIRFSLILATIHRTDDLARFLESLARQEGPEYELIVVDQNSDDRLLPIINRWTQEIASSPGGHLCKSTRHLRCGPGLSKARNLALMQCTGQILAFPDDDCWYLSDFLMQIDTWFNHHPEYDIVSVGSKDELGHVSNNRWMRVDCGLNRLNGTFAAATYTYFVRRTERLKDLRFDETLGPAADTIFGCGEDADFLLTAIDKGARGRFVSKLHVGHPVKGYVNRDRARLYGSGWGRIMSKHSLSLVFFSLVVFDLFRAVIYTLIQKKIRASHLVAHASGMVRGFFTR